MPESHDHTRIGVLSGESEDRDLAPGNGGLFRLGLRLAAGCGASGCPGQVLGLGLGMAFRPPGRSLNQWLMFLPGLLVQLRVLFLNYETHVFGSPGAYRKLVFTPDGDLLVGVLLVGDISRAGLYRFVIKEKMPVARIKSHIINHTLHYGHFMRP